MAWNAFTTRMARVSPYELMMAGMSAGSRIDVQWGLFLTINLALIGGLLKLGRPLGKLEKAIALVFYGIFAIQDYRIMRVQLNLMRNAYQDIAAFASDPCCSSSALISYVTHDVESGRFTWASIMVIAGHVLCAALVMAVMVVFRRGACPAGRT